MKSLSYYIDKIIYERHMKQLARKLATSRDGDMMLVYSRCMDHERLVFRQSYPTPQATLNNDKE